MVEQAAGVLQFNVAKAAVFGAVDYVSYGNIQQGESLKVIFPASGTVIAPRPMMILKTSQHAGEAKAFIDYVLSPEGQAKVADAWLMPAAATWRLNVRYWTR
ncbi:ABC transporter substrate-binding protein [Klebsiella pneumoniae]|nr:ABC transporter substrate-binding protein [Klebsiella pneumoniae]STT97372.1 ABC transporter substrate-binding protein [Klebsiella pneumoniae]